MSVLASTAVYLVRLEKLSRVVGIHKGDRRSRCRGVFSDGHAGIIARRGGGQQIQCYAFRCIGDDVTVALNSRTV